MPNHLRYLKCKSIFDNYLKEDIKHRILILDALRGIAALWVVLFHFTLSRPQEQLFFKFGTTGVDLFFMISGFVIFMSVQNIKTIQAFAIIRFCRLYPTYLAAVTFTFALIVAKYLFQNNVESINFLQYLANLTMFQFYFRIADLDGPYWTMIIEMLFYFIIGILFYFNLLKKTIVFGVLYILSMIVLLLFFNSNAILSFILSSIPLLKFLPLFLSGILFYNIWTKNGTKISNYLLLLGCLTCQILLYKFLRSSIFINQLEYAVMISIYYFLFVLFVNHQLNFIVTKLTLFLGKISFALYLVHQYLGNEIIIPFLTNTLHLNFWIAAFAIALPIVILIAYNITHYIEVPIGIKLKKYLNNKYNLVN